MHRALRVADTTGSKKTNWQVRLEGLAMFANVRLICREYRITPSRLEKPAGRLHRLPKSPARVTSAQRCYGTWRVGEGRKVRRDDSYPESIMAGPKKTPQPGQAWGVDEASEDGNLNDNVKAPASKLIAEANATAASIPSMTGRPARRAAASRVLGLWLQALQPGQQRQGSWRIAAAPGGLGRYEARKTELQSSDRPAARYSRGCRLMARQARV